MRDFFDEFLGVIIGIAVAIVIVCIVAGLIFAGTDTWNIFWAGINNEFWFSGMFPNGWNLAQAAPMFWVFIIIVVIVVGLIIIPINSDRPAVSIVISLVIIVGLFAYNLNRWISFNYDEADSYASSTTFVVDNPSNLPSALNHIVKSNNKIKKGSIDFDWDRRSASATGATIVLQRTGGAVSNTQLMTSTLTYLYNEDGTGTWSAIRNGLNQQYIYGVESWAGAGETKECRFTGKNQINYNFGGSWGKNLTNQITYQFPTLIYDEADMWGYCDGDTPKIVIPVVEHQGFRTLTTDRAAGVLVLTGSPSGQPVIKHVENIKAGDFPGPVYPTKLVEAQRDSANWAAGWYATSQQGFGFATTDVQSQAGNTSEYLLKSNKDGHLYWVTPLKSQSTEAQTIVAYSITRADVSTTGKLNPQKIYILKDNDIRAVNLDSMESAVTLALKKSDPGFFTGSAGKIAEFLPVTDDVWQVFAEQSGRVVYRIDVNADSTIAPVVYSVDPAQSGAATDSNSGGSSTPTTTPSPTSTAAPDGTAVSCDNPSTLTEAQIVACMNSLIGELNSRQVTPTK